jgi:hypothetical protein
MFQCTSTVGSLSRIRTSAAREDIGDWSGSQSRERGTSLEDALLFCKLRARRLHEQGCLNAKLIFCQYFHTRWTFFADVYCRLMSDSLVSPRWHILFEYTKTPNRNHICLGDWEGCYGGDTGWNSCQTNERKRWREQIHTVWRRVCHDMWSPFATLNIDSFESSIKPKIDNRSQWRKLTGTVMRTKFVTVGCNCGLVYLCRLDSWRERKPQKRNKK